MNATRLSVLLIGFALASIVGRSALAAQSIDRPNILLIMLDDLGFSDLGCYGASIIETPNLDRLAAGGLRFSQFYSTAKCHSSRICLLTGLYPFQAGNETMDRGVTLGEVMREAGYFTAMAGKWHLRGDPTERGFERHFGHLSGSTNYFTGDQTFRLNGRSWSEFTPEFYTTDANTDYAIRFINEALDQQKPFLMYVAYNAPHYPLQAPQQDVEKYLGKFRPIGWDRLRQLRYRRQIEMGLINPRWQLSPRPPEVPAWDELSDAWQSWEDQRMAAYAAMVDRVDRNIGRLVDHLQDRGTLQNTVILLCSDNGACPFERTRGRDKPAWDADSYWTYDVGWAHVGNTPFRWYKQNQHEGGIASPLIVHWPEGLKTTPGAITHQPGHLIDLLPTLVELGDATYPSRYAGRDIEPVQGKSLAPILRGQQRPPHEWLYFLFNDNRAIRRGQWKLVSAEFGPWELYDLANDRTELQDQAAERPELVQELKQLWQQVAIEVDHVPKRLLRALKTDTPVFPPKSVSHRELR